MLLLFTTSSVFFRTITLANTCSITNIYRKKKLRKKLKTCVTPLVVAPIKSGPLELRCELTHNTTTTPLLALFSRLPHKFLPVRGLSVSLILCLYLSFFAPNSQILTVCSSLFFFFFSSGENIGQGSDSRKAARSWSSASFLFFPAFGSLTADSTHSTHTCELLPYCDSESQWDVPQRTAAWGAHTSLKADLFRCRRNENSHSPSWILSKMTRKYFRTQLTYLVSDSHFTSTDVPGQCEPRPPYCRLNLGQKCRRHTLVI